MSETTIPSVLKTICIYTGVLLLLVLHLQATAAEAELPTAFSLTHSPTQPRSGEPVIVTANLPAETATLEIQVVSPGSYIRRTDPAFKTSWQDFPMEKHGAAFIARVPPEVQKHRSLVRYRVKSETSSGSEEFFPAETNAIPNAAWFVYDGLPAWQGASQPRRTPELTFSPEFLSTLPTYNLIADANDVKNSQWNHQSNRKPFLGTLVFDGRVYDHVTYNNRGQASTYVSGKNKWGVKFNAGHEFAARNNRGEYYKYKWTGMNMNPCASAWAQVNRGMAGMDEAIAYRSYQLAGVPSADTFWIHFRVIDSGSESPENQYNGDLWGLYLIVQEKNGTWLRENNLPDGNIFSIDSGPKHLASNRTANAASFAARFHSRSQPPQSQDGWRKHLDLPSYYSFHALNRLVANIDLRPHGNHYLYHRTDGRIVIVPHDLDMMLIPKHHQPGYVNQAQCLEVPALKLEYQARAREILDLLASDASPNGGQVGQLVAELSSILKPAGHVRNWAELDEAMWNWHPRSQHKGQFNVTPYDDHRMGGHWTRTLSTPDFNGFCQYIIDFCTDSRRSKNYRPNDGNQMGYGFGYLAFEARDEDIPIRPEIRFVGGQKFLAKKLSFTASPFKSASSAKAAAIQWRLGHIAAPGLSGYTPGTPYRYEIEPLWTVELPASKIEITIPPNQVAVDATYRMRSRYKDESGRWSHWSAPIQFTVAPE